VRKQSRLGRVGIIGAVFCGILGTVAAWGETDQADLRGLSGSPFALVLIDVDGLACEPCLAALREFCRAVPSAVQEERVLGVLTFRAGKTPDSRLGRIARTKWAGYSRANGIRFPVTLDESLSFNRLSEAGTTILLFDPRTGRLKRWTAPFGPPAIEEIVRFLITSETAIMETPT
jgi:hypothetical protein